MKSLTVYQTSNGYVSEFLRSIQFFTPHGGFPLITLLLGMLHCLLFKTLKAMDSLTRVPNFLFREFYLSLLFKFKTGPWLSLSCLMSCMFIIMRIIICITKTTCFDNTILMVELEGKLPKSRWSFPSNFPNFSYLAKIFGTHLQKGLVYFYTKKVWPMNNEQLMNKHFP